MKTKLPEKLETAEQVEAFLRELHANGEFFHLDDDAREIINLQTKEPVFTEEEGTKINLLLEQASAICQVWDLPVISEIHNTLIDEVRQKAPEVP